MQEGPAKTLRVPFFAYLPAKKNSPSIGEIEIQGCCEPPVAFFTTTPTRLKDWKMSRPGLRMVSASALL
jgi:hypothetical protein